MVALRYPGIWLVQAPGQGVFEFLSGPLLDLDQGEQMAEWKWPLRALFDDSLPSFEFYQTHIKAQTPSKET